MQTLRMWRCSIFASALCTLLLGGPIMGCLVPTAQLSAEEKQCCKEMAGECQGADSGMPKSHSCCDTVVRPHNDLLPSASVPLSAAHSNRIAFDTPLAVPKIEGLDRFGFLLVRAHAPPGSALEASSPLRI